MRWLGVLWGWIINPAGMHEADLDDRAMRHVTKVYGLDGQKAKCSCGWKRSGRMYAGAKMADAHEAEMSRMGVPGMSERPYTP